MIAKKIKDYLDSHNVKYSVITHSPAFTAQELAHATHIHGKEFAKTVMVNVDGESAMAVLPASYLIDFNRFAEQVHNANVYLENEEEFRDLFPDCEIGAMPPLGELYNMKVFVAQSLAEDEEIAFNAGTHTDAIKMKFEDFQKLVKPVVLAFSVARS